MHLRNAPIAEAVIDLRVRLPESFKVDQMRGVAFTIKEDYPTMEEMKVTEAKLTISETNPEVSTLAPRHIGFLFKSKDQKHIAQFRIDGFTLSRLKPYTTWAEFSREARRLWEIYSNACSPTLVNRLAVRYINQLRVPFGTFELSDFFVNPPEVAPGLPQKILNLLSRLTVYDEVEDLTATIVLASQGNPEPNVSLLVFDIDAFKAGQFQIGEPLFEILDKLRDLKNDIFFRSLTDRMVGLYK